jgi:hypothetical protein
MQGLPFVLRMQPDEKRFQADDNSDSLAFYTSKIVIGTEQVFSWLMFHDGYCQKIIILSSPFMICFIF